MTQTYTYNNNFDTAGNPLEGATQTTTGTQVGVTNFTNPAAGNSGNEFGFFSGNSESATLALPTLNLPPHQEVQSFTASMNLTIKTGTNDTFGNKEPDGISFNFGGSAPAGLEEQGTSTGLSVDIVPYQYASPGGGNDMVIKWNGVVIGTTSMNNKGSTTAGVTGTFSVGVDASGNVTASWGSFKVSATIPSDQWATTSQSNFNFNIAGRTGGNAGTAYIDNVKLNATVVCFARGTLIETETGPRRVESLRTGDRILTVDNGYQPIRWIGCSHVPAQGRLAPIRINTGTLGNTRPLVVSPHHRLLISGWRAELLFGEPEVLVAAKALVNDHSILRQEGGHVDYFHVLFDQPELIYAEGAVAESLFLGKESLMALSEEAREEIETLFPELAETGNVAHLTTARRVLTTIETRALQARAA